MKPFSKSSYLSQVRRLRFLAEDALTHYAIRNYRLDFISHGENATFRVLTPKQSYLLRLHRNGYHSKQAILEELKWLKNLSEKSDILAQKPIKTRDGHLVKLCSAKNTPSRYCSLLAWQPGHMNFLRLNNESYTKVGVLTAKLHRSTKNIKVKHRHYWTPQGLIGKDAKLGTLSELRTILPDDDFDSIERCRKLAYKKITSYQKQFPLKMSLIHADLHFGNMLWHQGQILPIDFDDCGYGFHLYDLAVTVYSSKSMFKIFGKKKSEDCVDSFLDGYSSQAELTKRDLELLPYFILTRKLAMLAWLFQRRDNPRLQKVFDKTLRAKIKDFKRTLISGPHLIES